VKVILTCLSSIHTWPFPQVLPMRDAMDQQDPFKFVALLPISYPSDLASLQVLLCFAGWHLFRFSRYIIGFVVGASVGYALAVTALQTFQKPFPPSWEPWVVLASTLLFALFGVILIKLVTKATLFAAGFVFGNLLTAVYSGSVKVTTSAFNVQLLIDNLSIWSVGAGLFCGILFIFFEKGFVILYSCAVGAYLVMAQLAGPPFLFYLMLIAGSIVQFWMSRGSGVKNMELNEIPDGKRE